MNKVEFQTKEKLIKELTLDGMTELIEKADNLGVDLESYIESTYLVNDKFLINNKFLIGINLVNKKEVIKYGKN